MAQTEYYHAFYTSSLSRHPDNGVYRHHFPVALKGGGELHLPFRRLNDDLGIALLMLTQVPNSVKKDLSRRVTAGIQNLASEKNIRIDTVAGIAKLGYMLGQEVSDNLGHEEWISIDTGSKDWYPRRLNTPKKSNSITSSGVDKFMTIDPFIGDRVDNKNVFLCDDVISSGSSFAAASAELLHSTVLPERASQVYGACIFTEGAKWRQKLEEVGVNPNWLISLAEIPVFRPHPDGSYQRI